MKGEKKMCEKMENKKKKEVTLSDLFEGKTYYPWESSNPEERFEWILQEFGDLVPEPIRELIERKDNPMRRPVLMMMASDLKRMAVYLMMAAEMLDGPKAPWEETKVSGAGLCKLFE